MTELLGVDQQCETRQGESRWFQNCEERTNAVAAEWFSFGYYALETQMAALPCQLDVI